MDLKKTPFMLNEKKKHIQKAASFQKTTILNIQMQQGEMIAEHAVDADVVIIVRSGEVSFTVEGEAVQVRPENLLHMEPLEKHSLKAESACDLIVMQIQR
ncbi:AraC family ligand binding domain-containing protein [Planococcus sp. YIM B11945]|uniref:AraC family ligand binding domain-containing protein n=1 Tax=Planococcus sp. YIM B11945 TaxID=3435410 RepID=UPI003D7E0D28